MAQVAQTGCFKGIIDRQVDSTALVASVDRVSVNYEPLLL